MRHLPALAVAIPLLSAATLVGVGRLLPRRLLDALGLAAAVATLLICLALADASGGGTILYWFGGWPAGAPTPIGIAFAVDPLGAGLAALAATLVVASLAFSWKYFDAPGPLYHALMLVFLAGMVGFGLTGDLFNLFVFFELMSVAAYALTGFKIEEEESLEGALNFAVINSLGAFLVLIGIALLYGRTGELNLAAIGRALASGPADGLVVASFALIASGFCVKGALVPFHFWLADAHAVAPVPVSVLFSGVMVELGLYAVARVYWSAFSGVFAPHQRAVGDVLLGLGAITAVVGGSMCLAQRHLKRLLAFSTIGHVGLIMLGLGLMAPDALAGAGVYVVGHGLIKGSLFLGVGLLLHRFGSVDEYDLHGRGRPFWPLATLFGLVGLGLAGLPPFATHPGATLIGESARRLGRGWVGLVVVFASATTGGAVLRVAGRVFLGLGPRRPDLGDDASPGDDARETSPDAGRNPRVMIATTFALATLALLSGTSPGLADRALAAAGRFVDRDGYAARVLDGRPEPRAPASPRSPTPGLSLDLLGPPLAIAIAAISLRGGRRRPSLPSLRSAFGRVQALQSGRVGDYAAWLVAGVALLGACLAVASRQPSGVAPP